MNDASMNETVFTGAEWLRYTRHLQLPMIGVEGQKKIKRAQVLIVGAGGLGSPVALYLAAAGVGRITIVDGDTIDLTNLQRQILFSTEQVGRSKALCAQERLRQLNPSIQVDAVTEHLNLANAQALVAAADLVMDCTDNFSTRYLINDTCVKLEKPWVFASIHQFSGQCALFTPGSACFRCLFPEFPQQVADCNTAGVLGVLPGLLGSLQSCEALKYLAGLPCALENNLLIVETMEYEFRKIQLTKADNCWCQNPQENGAVGSAQEFCENAALGNEISIRMMESSIHGNDAVWLDVREGNERQAYHIGGIHIPLDQLPQRLHELPKEQNIFCYCQTGIRSEKAVVLLREQGFSADNLTGGLVRYLKETV